MTGLNINGTIPIVPCSTPTELGQEDLCASCRTRGVVRNRRERFEGNRLLRPDPRCPTGQGRHRPGRRGNLMGEVEDAPGTTAPSRRRPGSPRRQCRAAPVARRYRGPGAVGRTFIIRRPSRAPGKAGFSGRVTVREITYTSARDVSARARRGDDRFPSGPIDLQDGVHAARDEVEGLWSRWLPPTNLHRPRVRTWPATAWFHGPLFHRRRLIHSGSARTSRRRVSDPEGA